MDPKTLAMFGCKTPLKKYVWSKRYKKLSFSKSMLTFRTFMYFDLQVLEQLNS